MNDIIEALRALRVPAGQSENTIHDMVARALQAGGFHPAHEAKLGPGQRIDFMVGSVGIEIKRGKISSAVLLPQIRRYLASDALSALIIVAEKRVRIPSPVMGKPVRVISLAGLWGVAL